MNKIVLLITLFSCFQLNAQDIVAIAKQKGKVGIIDKKGNWVIQPSFETIREFDSGYAMAKQNGKWGVIDNKGTWTIQPGSFEKIDFYDSGVLIAMKAKKSFYIDVNGNTINTPKESPKLNKFSEGYARFNDGKWGYINTSGTYAITPQYEDAKDFNDGLAIVQLKGNWGMIDVSGKTIINFEFEELKPFKNDVALAKQKGMWGIISKDGSWIIKPEYEKLDVFNDDYAQATKGANQGYVKKSGEFVNQPNDLIKAWDFNDGYAMTRGANNKIGYMDKNMNVVIEPKYEKGEGWSGSYARVFSSGKWKYVNEKGEEFDIENAAKLYKHLDGLAAVKVGNNFGYIDEKCVWIIKPEYENVEDEYIYSGTANMGWNLLKSDTWKKPNRVQYGFILAKKGGNFGAIDKTGNTVIPFQFEDIRPFFEF
jgi:hypothetical protein